MESDFRASMEVEEAKHTELREQALACVIHEEARMREETAGSRPAGRCAGLSRRSGRS